MPLGLRQFTSAATLAMFLMAGCNSVLGIEEARPFPDDEGRGGSGTQNGADPPHVPTLTTCNGPNGTCATCLIPNCGPALTAVKGNNEARKAVNKYRMCLGAACVDPETKCLEQLGNASADLAVDQLLDDLVSCVQTCPECVGSPLIGTEELYCACMTDQCASEFPMNNCEAVAPTVELEDLGCRLLHCEFAVSSSFAVHCGHAAGSGFCPPPEPPASNCTHLNKSKYPCATDGECCSGSCNSQICD